MSALRYATGQEVAVLAAFAALFALLAAAAVLGLVRRRRGPPPEPPPTRFVPHWQMMLMLGALGLLLASVIVRMVVRALR